MSDKLPSEAECKRASALLDEVIQPAFRYGERKRLVDRPFARFHENQGWWEGYPEEWEEHVLGMLAVAAVFTRPDRVAAFLRGSKTDIRDDAAALVRRWRTRPWAWAFFRVVEELGDRRLRVEPIGDAPSAWSDPSEWSGMLVYSRTVTENYRRGLELFFGLLVDVGPAFETYGVLIPFQGLEEGDALFMADVVSHAAATPGSVPLLGVADRNAPVSDIAARDPLPFLAMLRVSETPPVRTPHGPPGRYGSWVNLPEDSDAWSETAWRAAAEAEGEELAGTVFDEAGAGVTLGEGSPMYDPMIYLDKDNGRAFLEARTRVAYDRGVRVAGRIVGFPEEPQVAAGIIVVAAASQLLGLDENLLDQCGVLRSRYEEALVGSGLPDDEGGDEAEGPYPSSIEEFQAIADRLMRNYNEGGHQENETIAAELGVDPAVVNNVRAQLESTLSRMTERFGDEPEADRFGLSPQAFRDLVRADAPGVPGVLRLREANELRNARELIVEAPYQRSVSWLLEQALSPEGLGATKAGYISTQTVNRAYEIGLIPSPGDFVAQSAEGEMTEADASLRERFRPKKEADWLGLLRVRRLAESAKLLRLSGNRFAATDTALRLVDDPAALYRHLLTTAFRTVDWTEHRYFEAPPYLHQMAGFLFYAAGELCDARLNDDGWVPVRLLVQRFVAAVPELAEATRAGQQENAGENANPFSLSGWLGTLVDIFFVDYLGEKFGLLESSGGTGGDATFRTTPLFEAVFERG
ncbi:MAG: hypothetical protein ACLFO1_03265 [Spirochaetaceae bacterium]